MSRIPFDWKPAFLAALREYPIIQHACNAVGIERTTAYKARKEDEKFAEEWEHAMEAGIDRAEQEAFRRAVVGFEEPVIDKGRLAYQYERYLDDEGNEQFRPVLDEKGQPVPLTVRKHSDALLGLVLKGRRNQYGTTRTELTGADGGPVNLTDDTARSARAAQLLALAQQRKAAQDDFGDLA